MASPMSSNRITTTYHQRLSSGNGDGTFQAARSINPGHYPRDVVPVDVNGDGKIDLVVTNVGINQGDALFGTDGAGARICFSPPWQTEMGHSRR